MPELPIHQEIVEKLEYFQSIHKIPNIIFHGSSGSGKRTLVSNFIKLIYNDNRGLIRSHVMYVNCAHGKGIKFIRDDVKFFAKTHIHSNGGDLFKSIVLLNADKLTIDAQSALRRLIELFSHNTRFFIIVEEKYKLLRPILSRFCDLYIAEPMYQGVPINLYKYNSNETFKLGDVKVQRTEWLRKELQKAFLQVPDEEKLIKLSEKLYDKGYSALDIINLIEKDRGNLTHLTESKRYELLFAFSKVKKELRNEKLLMTFILTFTFVSSELSLENITFM